MAALASVLADSPFAYWLMEETSGTVMADSSGNARDGTFGGSPTFSASGPNGRVAVEFNGTNQWAEAPLDLSAFSAVTFEAWFYWVSFANDDDLLAEFTTNYNGNNAFIIDPNDSGGVFSLAHSGSGPIYSKTSFTRPPAGTWAQLVGVFDRSLSVDEVTVYFNGASQTVSRPINADTGGTFANSVLYLASRAGSALFGNCRLAHVAVFPTALSGARVTAHYNEMLGIEDKSASDTGTGTDSVASLVVSIFASDSGTGTDSASSLAVAISASDSGTGTDTAVSVAQAIELGPGEYEANAPGPLSFTSANIHLGAGILPLPAPGPSFSFVGGPPAPPFTPRVSAGAFSRSGATVADLAGSFERQWQHPLNDVGTGSLKLQNEIGDGIGGIIPNPDIAAIGYGDVIRFGVDGDAVYSILVERKDRASVAQGEEHDQFTTISGRGTLAFLEEAVVRPDFGAERALFQDTRRFDYGSPDLDDSLWGYAFESYMGKGVGEYPTPEDVRGGAPAGWPDATAWWIWDRFSSTLQTADPMPVGDVYFRHTFEVTADDGQLVAIFVSCDNQFQLVIDGVDVMEDQSSGGLGWGETRRVDVYLDQGTHQFALRCTNIFQVNVGSSNPAGLILAVYSLSQTLEPSTVLLHSDSSWLCLGYPAQAPGFTPGEVIRVVVDEAQADGALDGLVLAFTDENDSLGSAWPTTPDISVQVGLDLLSFIRQLCETYIGKVEMAPGSFTLYAQIESGSVTSATFAAGINLTELTHDESA